MWQETGPQEAAPGQGDWMSDAVISSQISLMKFQPKSQLDAFGASQSDSNIYFKE